MSELGICAQLFIYVGAWIGPGLIAILFVIPYLKGRYRVSIDVDDPAIVLSLFFWPIAICIWPLALLPGLVKQFGRWQYNRSEVKKQAVRDYQLTQDREARIAEQKAKEQKSGEFFKR